LRDNRVQRDWQIMLIQCSYYNNWNEMPKWGRKRSYHLSIVPQIENVVSKMLAKLLYTLVKIDSCKRNCVCFLNFRFLVLILVTYLHFDRKLKTKNSVFRILDKWLRLWFCIWIVNSSFGKPFFFVKNSFLTILKEKGNVIFSLQKIVRQHHKFSFSRIWVINFEDLKHML